MHTDTPIFITYARTAFSRMRGLLGKHSLPHGHGMVILPCNAIHTLGMKFPIDARFFDKQGRLVKTVRNIAPGKLWIWGGLKARAVLETHADDTAFAHLKHLSELPH